MHIGLFYSLKKAKVAYLKAKEEIHKFEPSPPEIRVNK